MIIFMHIPKTGGETLRAILREHFSPDAIYIRDWPQKEDIENIRNLSSEKKARIKLYMGHCGYYNKIHELFPDNPRYITVMREPIARVFSYYHYLLQHPGHWLRQEAQKTGQDFFKLLVEHVQNEVTRRFQFGGRNIDDALSLAKKVFREDFLFIGLLEKFDESIIFLKRTLNMDTPFYTVKNRNSMTNYIQKMTREQRDYITDHNKYDIELYTYANELFHASINNCPPDFFDEVAQFKELNKGHNA